MHFNGYCNVKRGRKCFLNFKLKIMNTTYFFIGLFTGISVSAFFIGKELYKYYTKYTVQKKQLDRILKLNDKFKKFKVA